MILTRHAIEQIESRIERAYLHHFPSWSLAGLDPRLWSAAAALLTDAHRLQPWVPVDPELFVACQIRQADASDPWRTLTHASARQRYIDSLRRIVRSLRRELRGELRRIELAARLGQPLQALLLAPSRRLSPLGRYLGALHFDRTDLAAELELEARGQFQTCALYGKALEDLVPGKRHGFDPVLPESIHSSSSFQFSVN